MRAYLCKRSYRLPAKSEPPSTRLRVVAPITIIPNICSTFKMIWIKFKKNEIIRRNTSKYSTNLSFQKFLWEKRNINQKPTKLNQKPCRILSKTANHLSILKILIEIFKISARNAPRILIYYMEKWTHQQKQREKFRKKRKNFKRKIKKKFYEKYS